MLAGALYLNPALYTCVVTFTSSQIFCELSIFLVQTLTTPHVNRVLQHFQVASLGEISSTGSNSRRKLEDRLHFYCGKWSCLPSPWALREQAPLPSELGTCKTHSRLEV
ncbi:hypothetical protein T484DRAFT_3150450 [Baffinella frigidus]|nr:hypothetical protein T484DRAFT_3150450 [Cryptophyta sp. CCMP2293]